MIPGTENEKLKALVFHKANGISRALKLGIMVLKYNFGCTKSITNLPTPRTPLSAHLWHAVVGGGVGNRQR